MPACHGPPPPTLPQAAIAQKEAAEAALEEDARSVLGGKDNLADATKDVAGTYRDSFDYCSDLHGINSTQCCQGLTYNKTDSAGRCRMQHVLFTHLGP
mgnify:CR=1 FL=1